MTLDDLIEIVAARAPQSEVMEEAARALGLSLTDVCDEVSRATALRFVDGRFSFEDADTIVNNLFAFATVVDGTGLPELAMNVYLAFDAGEYEHPGDPPELQGEARTRRLLAGIATLGLPPAPSEDPSWREAHRTNTRTLAVSVAKRVLDGELSAALGALELCRIRQALGIPQDDPDFETFILIDSESHAWPIGPVRQYWAPEALAAKGDQVRDFEAWALETGRPALRNVISRFGEKS